MSAKKPKNKKQGGCGTRDKGHRTSAKKKEGKERVVKKAMSGKLRALESQAPLSQCGCTFTFMKE